jgi:hypothetical protein
VPSAHTKHLTNRLQIVHRKSLKPLPRAPLLCTFPSGDERTLHPISLWARLSREAQLARDVEFQP